MEENPLAPNSGGTGEEPNPGAALATRRASGDPGATAPDSLTGKGDDKSGNFPSAPPTLTGKGAGGLGSADDEGPPLDPQTVAGWLTRLKPPIVLALLKDPDYALPVSRAFLGFRPDAKGYANPLVRSRLALAAVKDDKLAEKLRALADLEALTQAVSPKPAPTPARPALPSPDPKPDGREALRAERDQRRRERDEARLALAQAENERDDAVKVRQKAEAERDEAVKLARQKTERIGRLERQVTQLRQAETHLLRALNQDKVSLPPSTHARAAGPSLEAEGTAASPWFTAVRHLLDKSKFDHALALAEDVLKAEPENAAALDIAAHALEGKGEARQAAAYLRRLLAQQVVRRDMANAPETLLRLLRLLPDPAEAMPETRPYLATLSPSDGAAVEAARLTLSRLRGLKPDAYGWLTGYIAAKTSLGPVLMPPPGAISLDDPLPLHIIPGQTVTARQLTAAVDRGNVPLTDAARAALSALEQTDCETYGRLWTALEQAADDDPTRLIPLRRASRGPILVDGSNVAWFDQESLVNGRPRLRHLREMRRALRGRGYFPVVLYADANLPYFIDEPAPLRVMRDSRELTLVDAGTVADEVLLRTAKHLGAPLVTNDKMEDWDPEDTVVKIRYTISLGGEAHFMSEL